MICVVTFENPRNGIGLGHNRGNFSRYQEMEENAETQSVAEGMPADSLRIERFADMRYAGQEHTVKVPFPSGSLTENSLAAALETFHSTHEREYTFRQDVPVELVNFHVVAFSDIVKQPLPALPKTGRDVSEIKTGTRTVDFDEGGVHEASIYDCGAFEPDMSVVGPAVIEDATATLVISPGKTAAMDAFGNIHIDMRAGT